MFFGEETDRIVVKPCSGQVWGCERRCGWTLQRGVMFSGPCATCNTSVDGKRKVAQGFDPIRLSTPPNICHPHVGTGICRVSSAWLISDSDADEAADETPGLSALSKGNPKEALDTQAVDTRPELLCGGASDISASRLDPQSTLPAPAHDAPLFQHSTHEWG